MAIKWRSLQVSASTRPLLHARVHPASDVAAIGPNRRAHTAVGRLMMEKLSGRVAYAVMSFESFLGMGGGARHSMEQIDL